MLSTAREVTTVAALTSAGIALFVIESFIPTPLPFLKIGLANISSVLTLVLIGAPAMFLVVTMRVIVGSMLIGSLFSPGFILALSSGITSAAIMSLVWTVRKDLFSPLGISLIGALTHVVTQFVIVTAVYIQNQSLLFLLPLLLLSGVSGGVVVGWISLRLLNGLAPVRRMGQSVL